MQKPSWGGGGRIKVPTSLPETKALWKRRRRAGRAGRPGPALGEAARSTYRSAAPRRLRLRSGRPVSDLLARVRRVPKTRRRPEAP